MLGANHFTRDYRRLVSELKKRFNGDTIKVMHKAVGGDFGFYGQVLADTLRLAGLHDGMHVIDLGCGSGRLATVLGRDYELTYQGIDVVPDLIAYARTITPANYRFDVVERIHIPAADCSADMICAFSLFTHLLHEETYLYLEEVKRVLKPSGKMVFSFLELAHPAHWTVFDGTKAQTANGTRHHLNIFIERDAIAAMADHLDMVIDRYIDTRNGPSIPLSRPAKRDNGETVTGLASVGQTVCIMRHRAGA